jgi:hypothetical protein
MEEQESIKKRIELNMVQLNERQTRIYLASEAVSYGWGEGLRSYPGCQGLAPQLSSLA